MRTHTRLNREIIEKLDALVEIFGKSQRKIIEQLVDTFYDFTVKERADLTMQLLEVREKLLEKKENGSG